MFTCRPLRRPLSLDALSRRTVDRLPVPRPPPFRREAVVVSVPLHGRHS